MSIAPASMLTWLIRAVVATALMAFVASTWTSVSHAASFPPDEATQTMAEPAGDEIAEVGSSPLTADHHAPLDLVPIQAALVGPAPSRWSPVATDDGVASFDAGHLDRPPRKLSADPGSGDRRGA